MGLIKKKRGCLFWAIVAFLLAPCSFADMLEGRGGHMNPIHAGLLCLVLGCVLLYYYFTAE